MNNRCYGCFGAAMGDCGTCRWNEVKRMDDITNEYIKLDWVTIKSINQDQAEKCAELIIKFNVKEIYESGYKHGLNEGHELGIADGKAELKKQILEALSTLTK